MARVKQEQGRQADRAGFGDEVVIGLPSVPELHGHIPHRVEVMLYDAEHRAGLARLLAALTGRGQSLANGRVIESHADVVRYLLEQYEQAACSV